MNYEELLALVSHPLAESYNGFNHALRAVVELHKTEEVTLPDGEWGTICTWCSSNGGYSIYPCMTIQVIEKELNGNKKDS